MKKNEQLIEHRNASVKELEGFEHHELAVMLHDALLAKNHGFKLEFLWPQYETYAWENCEFCNLFGDILEKNELEKLYEQLLTVPSFPKNPFLVKKKCIYPEATIQWLPLTNHALFAQFADIEHPTQDIFLQWAHEHGRLINNQVAPNTILVKSSDGCVEEADSWTFWYTEQRDLNFAVMLWEMINENDVKLDGYFSWRGKNNPSQIYIHIIYKELHNIIDFKRLKKEQDSACNHCNKMLRECNTCDNLHMNEEYLLKILGDHSIRREPLLDVNSSNRENFFIKSSGFNAKYAAKVYLQQMISRKLALYPIQLKLHFDDNKEEYQYFEPSSLLSAMWYQLHLAMIGEIKLRRCILCKKWESMEKHKINWTKHARCMNREKSAKCRSKDKPSTTKKSNK